MLHFSCHQFLEIIFFLFYLVMANPLTNHAKLRFCEIIFAKGFIWLNSFAVIGSDILQILPVHSLLCSIYNISCII